jgi:hypothetical protein
MKTLFDMKTLFFCCDSKHRLAPSSLWFFVVVVVVVSMVTSLIFFLPNPFHCCWVIGIGRAVLLLRLC